MRIHLACQAGGPGADPLILDHFLHHYSSLGVTDFHIAVHDNPAFVKRLNEHKILIEAIPIGPFTEEAKNVFLNGIIERYKEEWVLLADQDEFHDFEGPFAEFIANQPQETNAIFGRLVDRFAADGFPALQPGVPIHNLYPIRSNFTNRFMGACIDKVAATKGQRVTLGHHRLDNPTNPQIGSPIYIDHFKWDATSIKRMSGWRGSLGAKEEAQKFIARYEMGGLEKEMKKSEEFFIVVACRNVEDKIEACLRSIRYQTHTNWKVVVVDDCSTDNTFNKAKESSCFDSRIRIVKNTERKYALRNIIETIWKYAPYDSIVVTVDGDDLLSDDHALEAIAGEYARTKADALWTRYSDTNGKRCISGPMTGAPLSCAWHMSHLRTFRRHLLDGIHPKTYVHPIHKIWWRWTYDQLIFRQVLHFAKTPVFYDRVCYIYNSPKTDPDYIDVQRQNAADMVEMFGKEIKKPGKVVLIVNGPTAESDRRFYYGEKRHPLGILSMASHLQIRKHDVQILDRYKDPTCPKNLAKAVEGASAVGIYCSTPNWSDAKSLLRQLRKIKNLYIAAGGPHAVLFPEQVLEAGAHCVCVGEADFEISQIVEKKPTGIINPGRIVNLDSVPMPAFSLAGMKGYSTDWTYSPRSPVYQLATSRGCRHYCAFCQTRDVWGREWYGQSPERMLRDVLHLRSIGASGVYFREDNFGQEPARVQAFSEGLLLAQSGLEWACEMRANVVAANPELIAIMAEAGCKGLYLGIEAVTDRMLHRVFHKGINSQQIEKSIQIIEKAGIKMALSFIDGHPLERKEEIEAKKALVAQIEARGHVTHRCPFRPKGIGV